MLERLGLVLLACTLVFGFAPYFYALADMLSDSDYTVTMLMFAAIVAGVIALTMRRVKIQYRAGSRTLHFQTRLVKALALSSRPAAETVSVRCTRAIRDCRLLICSGFYQHLD
jgi:EamA domain-containing membrane protein RarD